MHALGGVEDFDAGGAHRCFVSITPDFRHLPKCSFVRRGLWPSFLEPNTAYIGGRFFPMGM